MILIFRREKPLVIFGLVLILFSVGGLIFFYSLYFNPNSPEYINSYNATNEWTVIFVIISCLFYIIVGLGAMFNWRFGLFVFKAFLILFLLAFPVGTIISIWTLKYMKRLPSL